MCVHCNCLQMTKDKLELADGTLTVSHTLFGDCRIVRASHLVLEANTVRDSLPTLYVEHCQMLLQNRFYS